MVVDSYPGLIALSGLLGRKTATGTSNVRIAPRSPIQKSLVSELAAGETEPAVRTAINIALPALPKAHAVAPLYYALHAGLATRQKTKIQDYVRNALKDREQPELSLGEAVWEKASQLAGLSANTQAGKIAQIALKRTYASLLEKYRPDTTEDRLAFIDAIGKNMTEDRFVEEFLANYLLELVLAQMRTTNEDLRYNGARTYHYAGGNLLTRDDERKFRNEIMQDCEILARQVRKRISKTRLITTIREGKAPTEQVQETIQQALTEALREQKTSR